MENNEKLIRNTKCKLANLRNDALRIQDDMSELITDAKRIEQFMQHGLKLNIYVKEDAIKIRTRIKKLINDIRNMEEAIPCPHFKAKDTTCTTIPAPSH